MPIVEGLDTHNVYLCHGAKHVRREVQCLVF